MKPISVKSVPRFILSILLILLLIAWFVKLIIETNEFNLVHDLQLSLFNGLKASFYSNSFIMPILLLIAIIGTFISTKIGWILTVTFFYYVAFKLIFIDFPSDEHVGYDYLLLLIPISLILLMNLKYFRKEFNVFNGILTANMVSIIMGLGFTFLKGYIFLNHEITPWELIDKLT